MCCGSPYNSGLRMHCEYCDPHMQNLAPSGSNGLGVVGAWVYAPATWAEYERLQQEGAVFEGLVLDPVFRLA